MFVIGSLYAADNVHASTGAGRWFVIVLIFCFALLYVSTWGIVGKIYASEVQPAKTRAAANSLAQGLGFVSHSSFEESSFTLVALPIVNSDPRRRRGTQALY